MPRLPKARACAGLFFASLLPAAAAAQESPHSFAGKVALFSEYEFRGLSQTHEKPAVQLTLDYTHASGFYAGTFLTNIRWLDETAKAGGFDTDAKLEWDVYGGYRAEVAPGLTLDVGYLRYEYPSSGDFSPKPNTDEIYAGLTYGMFNVKYSHAVSDAFGVADSENSYFIEGNLAWPATEKLVVNAHVGYQKFKNNDDFSYTVWKLGATYDFGGGLAAGAYVKGTDTDEGTYTVNGKDWAKERLVAFVSYSF